MPVGWLADFGMMDNHKTITIACLLVALSGLLVASAMSAFRGKADIAN